MGFFHKIAKAAKSAVKTVEHTVTHPQEVIKTAVHGLSEVGHAVDDIAHGKFKEGVGELASGVKHTVDPAHLVGLSHQLARPFTDPVNKVMAKTIKGVTGHNVLGSHPLNTVGTVVAGVVTGGAASALIGGASLAGAAAAGIGALESAGSTVLGGLGTGLSAVGMDSAGAAVSGWSSELAAAAAGNASTAAASVGTGNWISHTADAIKEAAKPVTNIIHSTEDAVSNTVHKLTDSASHLFGTEAPKSLVTGGSNIPTWSANAPTSSFNGGIGSNALGSQNAAAQVGQHAGNAGTYIGDLQGSSVTTGDTQGFGFGDYSYSTAGSQGTSAGQMGITPVQTKALGASVTGNSGGYSALGDAATGKLGTGGVGLYGETAGGTIAASSGPTNLFNYGVNAAVPNTWNDALHQAANSNSKNNGFSSPTEAPKGGGQGGGGSGFKDALSKASGLKLDPDLGDQFKLKGQNLNEIDTSGLDIDQFKAQGFNVAGNYAPVQFTDY